MGVDQIIKVYVQNEAQPAANTDILADDLTPTNVPCIFRVQVMMSNAGNFFVTMNSGFSTMVGMLNVISGPALVSGGLYIFDVGVYRSGDAINFRYSATGGTVQILKVMEIYG